MKKLFLICGLLFGMVTLSQAQGGGRMGGTPEERAKRSTDQLVEKLKLNDEQKTKVNAIYLEQSTKMATIFESSQSGGDREAMRAAMTKANEETNGKISVLLNDDQKKAFTAWQAERAEAMKKRMEGRQAPPSGGQ